ncbi:MAG: hypothetical protein HY305_07035 [Sphingobacteriales bacterium]|nr:hypothetical protein [Sphingobacteriales bacterium]
MLNDNEAFAELVQMLKIELKLHLSLLSEGDNILRTLIYTILFLKIRLINDTVC